MTTYTALRHLPHSDVFRQGDVFVLFGELFGRGYVNGLLDQARAAGMTIVGVTVGRRDDDGRLRPLNETELAEAEANLGGRIINVPLMAGFDMDAPDGEPTPTQMLSGITLKNWQEEKLDWDAIERCRSVGVTRFTTSAAEAMAQIDKLVPEGANVFFAHTMAGGIPRIKAFLAIANRIYKGRGERFMSSRALIDSDLGKLILMNFDEVTANTLQYLIDASAHIRARVTKAGGQVRYVAYGYHGTEILIDGRYTWQTYTNYTQGYAKMRLERVATEAWSQGVAVTVFNCPEIRTNSSDIFVGVELSLFPLLSALKVEGSPRAGHEWEICQGLLREGASLQMILEKLEAYLRTPVSEAFRDFAAWPMDNTPELADLMIGTSEEITDMHADRRALITDHLSALVIEATGPLMFHAAAEKIAPVLWLNHDIIARALSPERTRS
jgi:hypothetical protein